MHSKIILKQPGRLRRAALRRATERAARDETKSRKPFVYQEIHSGKEMPGTAAYQIRVVSALDDWLESLFTAVVPALMKRRGELQEQELVVQLIERDLAEVEPRVRDPLKFGGHGLGAIFILAIASGVNFVVNWGFLEQFGWDFSTTLVAGVMLVAVEIAATAYVGRGIAACVLDRPGTPFDLEPAERRSTLIYTVAVGIVATALITVVALARGELVWMLAGLVGAGLGVWLGMAGYEARFHRQRGALRQRLARERRKATQLWESFQGFQHRALALARWLRDEAVRILNRGDIAFQRAFRHAQRHQPDTVTPAIPSVQMPSDADLEQRFAVLFDISAEAHGAANEEPGQGTSNRVRPLNPRRPPDARSHRDDSPRDDPAPSAEALA